MKWYKQTIGDTRLIQAGCRVRMTVYCELNMHETIYKGLHA